MGLTQRKASELFEYRNGGLFWRVDRGVNKLQGKQVGSRGSSGYLSVTINYRKHLVHRIVFLLHHGYTPERIDHIDGDPFNNHIENLRECTQSQNACNQQLKRTNTSGVKGVHWSDRCKRWVGQIQVRGIKKQVGYFTDKDTAIDAVTKARTILHGDFARI